MSLLGRKVPHVILNAEYNDKLTIYEIIELPTKLEQLSLTKPSNILNLEIKNPWRITSEEEKHLLIESSGGSTKIELQYQIAGGKILFRDWIISPQACFTIDATIRTPMPYKSIMNAPIYGYHVWGKYGYSRWISHLPRQEYILSIDEYLIYDDKNYIVATVRIDQLEKIRTLIRNIYSKSKDLVPWKRPIFVYNDKINATISTNIVLTRELSENSLLELLVKSIIRNTNIIENPEHLINTVISLIYNRDDNIINENTYFGLAKFYGYNVIKELLEYVLETCADKLEILLERIFRNNTDTVLALLRRRKVKTFIHGGEIECREGPCIIIIYRGEVESIKAILETGEKLRFTTPMRDVKIQVL